MTVWMRQHFKAPLKQTKQSHFKSPLKQAERCLGTLLSLGSRVVGSLAIVKTWVPLGWVYAGL